MKFFHTSIKIGDMLIVILALGICVLSTVLVYARKNGSLQLIIEAPSATWIYPLDIDRELEIQGILGITKISIQNFTVQFIDSPCSNKTCIAAPHISSSLGWIACLPNQVFAYITGSQSEPDIDITGY